MTIIQIPQGYYSNLDGISKDDAVASFIQNDAAFLARNPSCIPYHQPSWRELMVPEDRTAPWGHEWYVVDEAGALRRHSAQYDSSG